MRSHCCCTFSLLFLCALSLIAASSAPAEPPPKFLAAWGASGAGASQFNYPERVAVDESRNVYVVDSLLNERVQKFRQSWLEVFVGEPEPSSRR